MKILTDEMQFGFKKGVGCNDAIFPLRSTVKCYTQRVRNRYQTVQNFHKYTVLVNFRIRSSTFKSSKLNVRFKLQFLLYPKDLQNFKSNGRIIPRIIIVESLIARPYSTKRQLRSQQFALKIVHLRISKVRATTMPSFNTMYTYLDPIIFILCPMVVTGGVTR